MKTDIWLNLDHLTPLTLRYSSGTVVVVVRLAVGDSIREDAAWRY